MCLAQQVYNNFKLSCIKIKTNKKEKYVLFNLVKCRDAKTWFRKARVYKRFNTLAYNSHFHVSIKSNRLTSLTRKLLPGLCRTKSVDKG